jgi:hypothetical protein
MKESNSLPLKRCEVFERHRKFGSAHEVKAIVSQDGLRGELGLSVRFEKTLGRVETTLRTLAL